MRITTRGKVAVSAMTDLALHQRMKPVSLTTISQRQGTSLSYLEQLFSALRRAGLVESTRGPGGGYALARRAEQIAVAEIILAVENMDVDDYQPLTAPQVAQLKAMTGELWVSFNARVLEYLQSVSLKDLMEQAQAQGVVTAPEPEAKTLRKTSGIAPVARPLMARLQIPNSVFALGSLPLAPRR
ncbi:BadM/Rrf2 family transcriptional regulator [Acidovorax sp. 62]|uniref:Rrf2 family transcriptional regulator n=1 Tax=unclassified Acidovorax TaxID=2684926 RepID=UPI000C16AA43|nr:MULTISPECIES: Rrf2 family transcriptional regulator [unclassified Acidovorax]PIF27613.1 BadM/Rrf2 family transcriptional regulator [Acidovorax sp. 56]PIF92140.1 BadM/Rrf2 family transcriptional regulator [Acidovorax sp. 62]